MPARPVVLIVNPAAGGGRAAAVLPAVQARLRELEITFDTHSTRDLEHARELAADAAQSGRVAVTLGGDGLVGAVAGVLRHHPGAVLGVLPGGRGNDFARSHGIPLEAAEACDVIADGTEVPIDLGEVDGHAFVGIASVGFDSVANHHANRAPARLGRGVYVYAAVRTLATFRHVRFTISVDGSRQAFPGWSVAVANGPAFGGGMQLAPEASIEDGILDVVTIRASSRARYLLTLPRVFSGNHVKSPLVDIVQGREVTIAADRAFAVYADGDPIGAVPCTVRCLPGAIRVLLPAR